MEKTLTRFQGKLQKSKYALFTVSQLATLIIVFGIILRLYHYIDNRSLWLDETLLATNLVSRNFIQLTQAPLDFDQNAPIGFLWITRLFIVLFGSNEMILRLFPLLCGIASLFVFRIVARHFLRSAGMLVALACLAFAAPLVYHAVEVKQYCTELLATLLCLWLYIRYSSKYEFAPVATWGICGSIILFFSFSAIFVLAGIAMVTGIRLLLQRQWKKLFMFMLPAGMWGVTFLLNYLLFSAKGASSDWLRNWWIARDAFMPLPPTSAKELFWFFNAIYQLLDYPLGLNWNFFYTENWLVRILVRTSLLGLIFLFTGTYLFYRRKDESFAILVAPIGLTLLASGLMLYPFLERLIVFLAPIFILIIAKGAEGLIYRTPARVQLASYMIVIFFILSPLMISSMQAANTNSFGGYKQSSQREALLYVNQQMQPGDKVYLHWQFESAYIYYKSFVDFKFNPIIGKDIRYIASDTDDFLRKTANEFAPMKGKKRVWIILNQTQSINPKESPELPEFKFTEKKDAGVFINVLNTMGEIKDSLVANESKVLLYDLSD